VHDVRPKVVECDSRGGSDHPPKEELGPETAFAESDAGE